MKKIISIFLLSTLSLGMISCGKNEETKKVSNEIKNKEIITVWAWDKNFNIPIIEKAAEIYSEKNPNFEIKVIDTGRDEIEQKLHTSLSTGAMDTVPDIVLIEDYSAQKFLTSYPDAFTNLEKIIDYTKFAKYKVLPMTVDGKIYGIPFDSGVAGLFYRRDYLAQAGIPESDLVNITWSELIEIGKIVKEKTGKQLMAEMGLYDPGTIRMMMQSAGGWFFNDKGEVNLVDNEALKASILDLKNLCNSGLVNQANGWGEWVSNFNSGKVTCVPTGAWIVGTIKSKDDQSGLWGLAPIPRLSTVKSVNASNLGGSSWYILNKPEKNKIAADFMNEIFGKNIKFYDEILINRGAIGTYLPAQESLAYKEKDKFFKEQEIYKDLSKWMSEIPPVNYGIYVREADQAMAGILKYIVDGNMTIEDGLKKAEDQLNSQIQF